MEIFILLALAIIMIFVLVKISLVILGGKPMLKKKGEEEKGWEESKAIWDNGKPAHYYDPSDLRSPHTKTPNIKSGNDD